LSSSISSLNAMISPSCTPCSLKILGTSPINKGTIS
jgi:hypothetical protein